MRGLIAVFILIFGVSGYSQQIVTVSDKSTAFDVTYESLKLYPNPVITNAVLEFKLSERSQVQVTLLNILGAQIKNMLNESRSTGRHSIPFGVDQLQRGTYFIRLSINGEIIKTVRVAVSPQ